MLHIRGEGEILSRKYEEKRNKGIKDHSLVPDDYDWLGLEFPQGHGKDRDSTYIIRSRYKRKRIDIRERPEAGGI